MHAELAEGFAVARWRERVEREPDLLPSANSLLLLVALLPLSIMGANLSKALGLIEVLFGTSQTIDESPNISLGIYGYRLN